MELSSSMIQDKEEVIIVKCCICQKVLLDDLWVHKKFILTKFFSLLGIISEPSWSHGYCPCCMKLELDKFSRSKPLKLVTEVCYEQHESYGSPERRFSPEIRN